MNLVLRSKKRLNKLTMKTIPIKKSSGISESNKVKVLLNQKDYRTIYFFSV
jgi:hypothetical protein